MPVALTMPNYIFCCLS